MTVPQPWPLVLAVSMALPAAALAWDGTGHQVVALIAEDQLTPAARAAVADLLDGGSISDAEVASWADEIRRERQEGAVATECGFRPWLERC